MKDGRRHHTFLTSIEFLPGKTFPSFLLSFSHIIQNLYFSVTTSTLYYIYLYSGVVPGCTLSTFPSHVCVLIIIVLRPLFACLLTTSDIKCKLVIHFTQHTSFLNPTLFSDRPCTVRSIISLHSYVRLLQYLLLFLSFFFHQAQFLQYTFTFSIVLINVPLLTFLFLLAGPPSSIY